ncbi:hypothetical protein TRM7615_00705 [Falsiruegeria mediterranea M17]|uniref:Uncharacterized protein n=1 Tax=Falsiruegeria mediterranea M17 TaxID=1200281 RepID=A0A2R8C484_9RHOB|nr:hypothetical protein TRM7615_00705 [Falsiruegeria mediterranea M17]
MGPLPAGHPALSRPFAFKHGHALLFAFERSVRQRTSNSSQTQRVGLSRSCGPADHAFPAGSLFFAEFVLMLCRHDAAGAT